MKILKNKVYKHKGEVYVKIYAKVEGNTDVQDVQWRLNHSLEWMLTHAEHHCPYDFSSTIDIFALSLEALGKEMIREIEECHPYVALHQRRNARRALVAARLLRQAYDTNPSKDELRVYNKFRDLLMTGFKKQFLTQKEVEERKYADKMWDLARARHDKIQKERLDYVWKYIKKYLPSMWS